MTHEQVNQTEFLIERRHNLARQINHVEATVESTNHLLRNLRDQLRLVEVRIKDPMKADEIEAAAEEAFEMRFDEFF